MFALPSNSSRRDFLNRMGAGFGAFALGALLRLEARAAAKSAVALDPLNPFQPRPPAFTPRAKSVIFLFMVGGPSHMDTFDYKPALQRLDGQPVPKSLRQFLPLRRSPRGIGGSRR